MAEKRKTKKQDDIDFEIRFMESLLEKIPGFTEALVVLGDLYTKKGLFQEGLAVDERLSCLRPHDPIVLYNLACSYSLIGDIDRSFSTIKKAIESGYDDFGYLKIDGDLSNLRQDARFREYFSNLRKKTSDKT